FSCFRELSPLSLRSPCSNSCALRPVLFRVGGAKTTLLGSSSDCLTCPRGRLVSIKAMPFKRVLHFIKPSVVVEHQRTIRCQGKGKFALRTMSIKAGISTACILLKYHLVPRS